MTKDTKELKDIVNNILPTPECIAALNNCNDIRDLRFDIYCRLLMILSPQKRTSLIEKRLRLHFGWVTVNASKELGDYIDNQNKYFELKTSCPNSSDKIMVRQVRLWQNVDYYLVLYIDCFNLLESQAFVLTKDEMIDEAFNKGSFSHKTKASSEGDKKRELSFSISVNKNNSDNKEWTEKYGRPDILKDILTF